MFKNSKSDSNDKLRKLDAVSPTRTLEEWWSRAKGPLLPSEGADGHFIWCVDHLWISSDRFIYF